MRNCCQLLGRLRWNGQSKISVRVESTSVEEQKEERVT